MNRKNNKITELEKLQLRKIRLQAEADAHVRVLDGYLSYLQDNLGTLLVNSVMTTAQSKMPSFLQGLLPVFMRGHNEKDEQSQTPAHHSKTGVIIDQVIDIVPLLFKGAKPVIIAFLLKKAKNLLYSKK